MAKALHPPLGIAPMTDTTAAVPGRCPYCGFAESHPVTRCRAVKEVHYYPNGSIQKIVKR